MPPLRVGSVGDDVVSLHLALVAVGLLAGEPTNVFDTITQRAVIELQRQAGLPQTGVMDDATWDALYRAQANVAPTTGGEVVDTPRKPGTVELDTLTHQAQGNGLAILLALGVGLATFWAHNKARSGGDLGDEEADDEYEDDEEEGEGEDIDFEPPAERRRGRPRLSDLDDAVTDSLLDEPAIVSSSRKPGDCKKAARMLMSRAGLATRPQERSLYQRVVRKVADNCHDQQDAVKEAIDEEMDRQEEIADELEVRAGLETESYETNEGTRSRRFVAPGFRKTKTKWTKKSTGGRKKARSEISPGEKDLLDQIAHEKKPNKPGSRQGGRPGAAAIRIKKRGGETYRVRKEKAKTKTGYTWRKVKD